MPPRTTFALADRQKDSCLHPSRPKRNIIQKEKAGNAPSLAHEKGHRQTHRQTTTTLIASGPPLRGDPYFVCISTTLLIVRGPSPQNVQVCAHGDYSNFLCTDPGELDSCFNLVHVGICWHGRFIRKWRLKFNYLLPWQLHSNSVVTSCFLHWNEVQHGFKPFRSITFFC